MSKLTKPQIKAHKAACDLLTKDHLTYDDKWQVLEDWQESATHINSAAGAFFTPNGLAQDFAIEVAGRRILDLCAGIGKLAFMVQNRFLWASLDEQPEITCVEINPDYIAVGKKVLPEARWIEADVFGLPALGRFDCVISNPPFGATRRSGRGPRFTGKEFEYHVIDIASDLADYGVFIVSQGIAPFRYSGQNAYSEAESESYKAFRDATKIELTAGCGIDTDYYRSEWRGVAPATEIVCADFTEARAARNPAPAQLSMFAEAAA
jgi:predicted RNA methylase